MNTPRVVRIHNPGERPPRVIRLFLNLHAMSGGRTRADWHSRGTDVVFYKSKPCDYPGEAVLLAYRWLDKKIAQGNHYADTTDQRLWYARGAVVRL